MWRSQHLNLRDQANEFLVVHHLQIAATHLAHLQLALQMIFDDERLQTVVILVLAKGAAKPTCRPGPPAEAAVQVAGGSELLPTQLGKLGLRPTNPTDRPEPPLVFH